MEDQQADSDQQHLQRKALNLCEECNSKAFKYKCPACSCRTCSLPCVNSHKQRFRCTGKRNPTQFVPLSQFDDSTLLSDYNLLEDVKRVAESAQRMRVKLCGYHHHHFGLPFRLKALRGAAARKGTKLLFLPAGMAKREKNRTHYNQRKKSIFWTIEWRFNSTDVILLEHGVHESSILRSVIEKHLQPSPWKNKLRRFCEENVDNLKFFIRKHHKDAKSPYRELDVNASMRQLFGGLVILEYPVINVFLPSDTYDFQVVNDIKPPPIREVSKRDESSSLVGSHFKEEEIQEDHERAPEPQIIDLLKASKANLHEMDQKQSNDSVSERPGKSFESNSGRQITESDKALPGVSSTEVQMLDAEIGEFDFEQDLIDAYSFLMEESNPDDFLNYKPEGEDHHHHQHAHLLLPHMEELEEGEIPNFD